MSGFLDSQCGMLAVWKGAETAVNREHPPIEALFERLASLPEVEAIALGGSRAGADYDEASDYDVYLYCRGEIPEEVRRDLLAPFCSRMELGNCFWEYEDNCTLTGGVDIDLLYRNLDEFVEDVADVVERCRPRNGYTTCMWHNLRTCRILYDRHGRLARAKARFDVPYPPLLRQNVIAHNRRLLHQALPAYDGQLKKALARSDAVSVNHRAAAFLESYFDILFALNSQTHPGEKRLAQLCRRQCALLPADFEENLQRLFSHLFAGGDQAGEDVDRIVAALERILPQ